MGSAQSKLEAAYDYMRMCYLMGTDTFLSNSITYQDYMTDSYVCWYDLTTDTANIPNFIMPATRRGNVRIRVTFNQELKEEMVMIVYSERNHTMAINEQRVVLTNYVDI